MSNEITPDAEADATPAVAEEDTEGHRQHKRVTEAGEEDTEGHIAKNRPVSEAGDDDTEGHIAKNRR